MRYTEIGCLTYDNIEIANTDILVICVLKGGKRGRGKERACYLKDKGFLLLRC